MPHRTFRDLPEFTFWKVLHEIAEDAEPGIRRRFVRAVERMLEEVGRPGRAAFIRRALERGDVATAVDALPWEVLEAAMQEIVEEEVAGVFEEAARATARQLQARREGRSLAVAALRAGRARAEAAIVFDLQNPRAIRWLEEHAGALIREVSEESRAAVRQILVRQARQLRGPRSSVRAIREVVGLTRNQAAAVENFREALEEALGGDLTRAQIERRFTLSRRMGLGRITEDRVDLLVDRYRARMVRHRAENIARTETIEGAAAGQRELWREAQAEQVITEEGWEREWVAIVPSDGRTCKLCVDLDGKRAPLNGQYVAPLTPQGIDGPTRHTKCRCGERIVRKQARRAA